jgi:hypothetical protein
MNQNSLDCALVCAMSVSVEAALPRSRAARATAARLGERL